MTTLICSGITDAHKLMFVYEKVHQLLGDFVPQTVRPRTGALPLDSTGGLPSPRPPLQLDPHFSKGSAASGSEPHNL